MVEYISVWLGPQTPFSPLGIVLYFFLLRYVLYTPVGWITHKSPQQALWKEAKAIANRMVAQPVVALEWKREADRLRLP